MKLTRQQKVALQRVHERTKTFDTPSTLSYLQFRRTVQPGPGCIMVPYGRMWLGIEPNGLTHS